MLLNGILRVLLVSYSIKAYSRYINLLKTFYYNVRFHYYHKNCCNILLLLSKPVKTMFFRTN